MLESLAVGQCLLEYALPDDRYLLIERTIAPAGAEEPDPFSVSYRVRGGAVLYRGTCNVTASDREVALDRISWAPGNGDHAAGNGWRGGVSFGSGAGPSVYPSGVVWLDIAHAEFNWDPYDHYDYCYYMADENGDVLYVLSCGYNGNGGGCTQVESPTVRPLGGKLIGKQAPPNTRIARATECTDPGGGSSGGGSGEDPNPDPEPECDPRADSTCVIPMTEQQDSLVDAALEGFLADFSAISDATVADACQQALDTFQSLLGSGMVQQGSTDVGEEEQTHMALYDGLTGIIHIDASYMDDVLAGNAPMYDLANSLLHEAMHVFSPDHGPNDDINVPPYGLQYQTAPYSYLNYGPDSCIDYSSP